MRRPGPRLGGFPRAFPLASFEAPPLQVCSPPKPACSGFWDSRGVCGICRSHGEVPAGPGRNLHIPRGCSWGWGEGADSGPPRVVRTGVERAGPAAH